MPIPSPTTPSSETPISAVDLRPTQSNKAFYIYSGEISVDNSETTMISVNDIGKRDILICLEVACATDSAIGTNTRVKSNGVVIHNAGTSDAGQEYTTGFNEIKFILPANTSLEVTIKQDSSSANWTVAGYGYYL